MRGLLKPLLFVAVVLLVPFTAYAQTGSIAGIVRDPSGAVIPGVTVEVSSPALIEKVRSTTNDNNDVATSTSMIVWPPWSCAARTCFSRRIMRRSP